MKESRMTGQLAMQWIQVVDPDGRAHMEAHWHVVGAADVAAPHAA